MLPRRLPRSRPSNLVRHMVFGKGPRCGALFGIVSVAHRALRCNAPPVIACGFVWSNGVLWAIVCLDAPK